MIGWLMLLWLCSIWAVADPNTALAPHSSDFVAMLEDKVVPFDATEFLRAKYTVLYFGAGWCPDCRRFSPALVDAYDRQPAKARAFEVLLLSRDRSAAGMAAFMKTEKMKWPALRYDKLADAKDLERFYSGQGIPCLTVIDTNGRVVLQSRSDQDGKDILRELLALVNTSAK